MVDKVRNKLSNWKGRLVSFTGRVHLIKFVISPLPLLYLAFFKASKSVCKSLKRYKGTFSGAEGLRIER